MTKKNKKWWTQALTPTTTDSPVGPITPWIYKLAGRNNTVKSCYLIVNALIFHSGVSLILKATDSPVVPITPWNAWLQQSDLGSLFQFS